MKVNASNVREMSRLAFVICVACVVADMPHRSAADGAVTTRQMTTIATVVPCVVLPS